MQQDPFVHEVEAQLRRVSALLDRSAEVSFRSPELLEEALAELQIDLEELRTAADELEQQNQELAATREAVEAERARYQDLFNFAPDPYLVTDPGGVIREANHAALVLLGIDRPFLTGKPLVSFLAPGERASFRSALSRLPQIERIEEWPVWLRPRDGSSRLVAVTVVATRDARGACAGLRWLLRDITLRQRTEGLLRAQWLFDGTQGYALFMVDPEGRVITWNPGASRLLGYAAGEMLGREVSVLFSPEDRSQSEAGRERQLALQVGRCEEDRWLVRQDGSRFFASGTMTPLHDEAGRLQGFVWILRDLTEKHRLEQAMRREAATLAVADRRKDEFLAVLAHELRNPLTPILNVLYLLKQRLEADPSAARHLEIADRQVRHLSRLVEDLLDVSRIAQNRIDCRFERVDLVSLVRQAAEDRSDLLQEGGLSLVLELPEAPIWLSGDPARLTQVVGNLLQNAIKFTDAGGEIRIRMAVEGDDAIVSIRDTGIGIDAAILPHVFETFRQADRSRDRSRGGLGLGLSLVKGLVERHGGDVRASSDGPGRGSEFVVCLPLEPGVASDPSGR